MEINGRIFEPRIQDSDLWKRVRLLRENGYKAEVFHWTSNLAQAKDAVTEKVLRIRYMIQEKSGRCGFDENEDYLGAFSGSLFIPGRVSGWQY